MKHTGSTEGICKIGDGLFEARIYWVCPKTGKRKEALRRIQARTAREAGRVRRELRDELSQQSAGATARLRVGVYARSWLEAKMLEIDRATATLYAEVLEGHVLPALGDVYLDALHQADVQAWVTRSLTAPRWRGKGTDRRRLAPYSVATVHGWYRVLRTMMRDAIEPYGLAHDPTARVKFPPAPERAANGASREQIGRFLSEMRTRFPQHFAMTTVMVVTGLRFCHASALRWDDLIEAADGYVLRVERKQYRGKVGAVSRKKRAPKELALPPELAELLKAERRRMVAKQVKGVGTGYMFPSRAGTLRQPGSLRKAWSTCAKAAGITGRFTVHGTRYTFTDLGRHAGLSDTLRQDIAGHTPEMVAHYSTFRREEQRAGLAAVMGLVAIDA